MFRYPCLRRQAPGGAVSYYYSRFPRVCQTKVCQIGGDFLDELYQDVIRHLKEEVWLWRIIAFVLAAAVIIALFF